MMRTSSITKLTFALFSLFLFAVSGCGSGGGNSKPNSVVYNFGGPPRMRMGEYPTNTLGTNFMSRKLGTHGYGYKASEGNGIVYTCRAGHVDIIHLHIAADWTAYLTAKTFKALTNEGDGFTYHLEADRTKFFVRFSYPDNWKNLPKEEKERIAAEVSPVIGQYLTFTTTTWHEILTWFGFKCLGVLAEFPSAFSWEESFSNLLGTRLAAQAMQDKKHSYDEAMTIAIDKELEELGIQPAAVAQQASEKMRGPWFTGSVQFFVTVKRRNFDIGLKDGFVTPILVPDVAECPDAKPLSYPVPNPDILSKYGLSMKVEIEPGEWESGKILSIVYGKERKTRIDPAVHFAPIMVYIEKEAAEKYGYIYDGN